MRRVFGAVLRLCQTITPNKPFLQQKGCDRCAEAEELKWLASLCQGVSTLHVCSWVWRLINIVELQVGYHNHQSVRQCSCYFWDQTHFRLLLADLLVPMYLGTKKSAHSIIILISIHSIKLYLSICKNRVFFCSFVYLVLQEERHFHQAIYLQQEKSNIWILRISTQKKQHIGYYCKASVNHFNEIQIEQFGQSRLTAAQYKVYINLH